MAGTSSLSAAQFLALFDRIHPASFLAPRKESGLGYDYLRAAAAMGERASLATKRLFDSSIPTYATGAAFSTGLVEFYRGPNPAAPAVVIKAGTRVATSRTGREYITLADASFTLGGSVASPQVTAQATVASGEYDVKGPGTSLRGEAYPGEIDTVVFPVQTAPGDPVITLLDLGVQVRQVNDFVGGIGAGLDQIAAELGLFRGSGESDVSLRERIRASADVVSPDAIERLLELLFGPLGLSATFIELDTPAFTGAYDVDTPPGDDVEVAILAYDRAQTVPFLARLIDETTDAAAFVILVPKMAAFGDHGFVFDVAGVAEADFTSTNGFISWPAFDIVNTSAVVAPVSGAFDGEDIAQADFLLAVKNSIDSARAGGVAAIFVQEGE